jgi:2-dehydro-3-deoxygluconokinase
MQVATFGEALFRLNPPRGVRWESASTLEVYLGGTELNIAANLVSLGTPAAWISILPEGESGRVITSRLRDTGVDVRIPFSAPGDPGWYMLEEAARPRGDRVLTRVKSVLGHLPQVALDWAALFKGAQWFHTSGVTAGLSPACTQAALEALKTAKSLGLTTSYDLNFRKNLWDHPTSLQRQRPLLPYIDVLVCGEAELAHYAGEVEGKTILIPHRDELESTYWVEARTPSGNLTSRQFKVDLTDRIGVGDAMLAGWIHATLQGQGLEERLRFAAASGALKYSVKGDRARLHESEVFELLEGGYKGIKR